MRTKAELTELINDYMSDKQANFLYKLVNTFCSDMLSKGDLMEFSELLGTGKIDSAMPIDYTRSIQDILPSWNHFYNVMDYRDKSFGEITNVAEEVVKYINKNLTYNK